MKYNVLFRHPDTDIYQIRPFQDFKELNRFKNALLSSGWIVKIIKLEQKIWCQQANLKRRELKS